MRVWLLAPGEPLPIDGANVRFLRMGMLSEVLAKRGHQVTWWTSTFNHPQKQHRFPTDKTIVINEFLCLELLHGIAYKKNISISRLFNHQAIARKFRQYAEKKPLPDVIHCTMPIPEFCSAAVAFGHKHDIPVIIDFRDLWPDVLLQVFPGWSRPLASLLLTPIYRSIAHSCKNAKAICGVSLPFVQHGLKYAGRAGREFDCDFPLGYPTIDFSREEMLGAQKFWNGMGIAADKKKFVVSYVGTLGKPIERELFSVICAAQSLQLKNDDIIFVICGSGESLVRCKSWAKNCRNIYFPGWINPSQVQALIQMSSLGLIPYPSTQDCGLTLSNKFFEYLSGGLPIISSIKGLSAQLLMSYNCGLTYENQNHYQLSSIISELHNSPEQLSAMSRNAYNLYCASYVSDKIYTKMSEYLEKLVSDHKNKS